MAARNVTPIYMQVAVDVAGRIARDQLKVGQKISGRTTLASEYNVSPETIRKAMWLLEEVGVIKVTHGSGSYIASKTNAEEFAERYKVKFSVNDFKKELSHLMKQRDEIEQQMNLTMNTIIDYSSRFRNTELITIYEYFLDYQSDLPEKSIGELNLKKETGVTLVGISRAGVMMISPPDEEIIKAKDTLYYVGINAADLRLDGYLHKIYDVL
ncbi:GntR family transcriptional regulator [Eubacteriaceae bacterium ES2]|nr:GntR family transcriptional regulator [Eubacteriaceae bacterium ES2]